MSEVIGSCCGGTIAVEDEGLECLMQVVSGGGKKINLVIDKPNLTAFIEQLGEVKAIIDQRIKEKPSVVDATVEFSAVRSIIDSELECREYVSIYYLYEEIKNRISPVTLFNWALRHGTSTDDGVENIHAGAREVVDQFLLKSEYGDDYDYDMQSGRVTQRGAI